MNGFPNFTLNQSNLMRKNLVYLCIVPLLTLLLFSCHSSKKTTKLKAKQEEASIRLTNREIREKYAAIMRIEPHEIENLKLYYFINKWYGVPYQRGNIALDGTDCSGFAGLLCKEVYQQKIERNSAQIFEKNCRTKNTKRLKEGDLLFFKTEHDYIDHVGIYLHNNYFVHATVKLGVVIDNLGHTYWKRTFYKGGSRK